MKRSKRRQKRKPGGFAKMNGKGLPGGPQFYTSSALLEGHSRPVNKDAAMAIRPAPKSK